MVIIGSVITAVGLQFFLLPNHLVDGGVTGLSIIVARLSGLPIGLFLLLFNLPFLWLGYRKFGKQFAIFSAIGIATLAALTFTHYDHGFTHEPILAAVFGGLIVGLGIGTAIRFGGTIDGTDTVAVLIDRVTIFSVSEAILFINALIISLAGVVFGWEYALYSLIAYFVAHKAIDVMVEGFDESRAVWIVSMHVREIGHAINKEISEPVTYIRESDPSAVEPHGIMLAVITRLEEQRVKKAIQGIDKHAYVVMSEANEIMTGRVSTNSVRRRPQTLPESL